MKSRQEKITTYLVCYTDALDYRVQEEYKSYESAVEAMAEHKSYGAYEIELKEYRTEEEK